MNKQELIKEFREVGIYNLSIFGVEIKGIPTESAIALIEQLDEPETGHADEAPRYLKNLLARLRELPLHNREVWLKVIMSEFKQDFSHAKWREGYEQGKLEGMVEGMVEREKVKVPQCVAKKINYFKKTDDWKLLQVMDYLYRDKEIKKWLEDKNNQETVARAWLDGYEVEKEKKFFVKIKCLSEEYKYLNYFKPCREWLFSESEETKEYRTAHTRKELEEAGFGWVFDCPGIEIEEVE